MNMSANHSPQQADILPTAFLVALPRIQRHGRVYFRHVKDMNLREEYLAEMVAVAWLWFRRLARAGKNPCAFISVLATFAARAVRSGRRLCGQERARDVLSRRAQRRHGFSVRHLCADGNWADGLLAEALQDNTQSPPAEQAAFRHDFPLWLSRLGPRLRRIALDMALGHRTSDLAHFHGCSPARISQLRRTFHADWQTFCDVPAAAKA